MNSSQINSTTEKELPVAEITSGKKSSTLRKVALILGCVLIILIIAGYFYYFYTPGNPKAGILVNTGDTELAKNNYANAQNAYASALKIDKNDPLAQSGLINSISLVGNQTGKESTQFNQTKPYIDQALKSNPRNPVVLLSVGYAYETAGNYEKALSYYTLATDVDPNSSEAWFHKGHALQFLNKSGEAKKSYDKAYSLNPNNPLVLITRGNDLLTEKKFNEAYDNFNKASKNSALSPQTRSEALTSASVAKRYQSNTNSNSMNEALSLSKQAIDADSGFSPALATYGLNLAMTGRINDGIAYLEKAISANPRISLNYFELAEILRSNNDYTNAINNNKKAVENVDNDNTLVGESNKSSAKGMYLYELAKTYSASGLSVDLLPILKESFGLNPNMKTILRIDHDKYGYFKDIYNKPDFLLLINS